MGFSRNANVTYIIDFSLSKEFQDPHTCLPIPFGKTLGLTGTLTFASINSHLGLELRRRDDLESLAYVLIYFSTVLCLGKVKISKVTITSSRVNNRFLLMSCAKGFHRSFAHSSTILTYFPSTTNLTTITFKASLTICYFMRSLRLISHLIGKG